MKVLLVFLLVSLLSLATGKLFGPCGSLSSTCVGPQSVNTDEYLALSAAEKNEIIFAHCPAPVLAHSQLTRMSTWRCPRQRRTRSSLQTVWRAQLLPAGSVDWRCRGCLLSQCARHSELRGMNCPGIRDCSSMVGERNTSIQWGLWVRWSGGTWGNILTPASLREQVRELCAFP